MSSTRAASPAGPVLGFLSVFLLALTINPRSTGHGDANAVHAPVRAEGIGNPFVSYGDGYLLPAESRSLDAFLLVEALRTGHAEPTTAAIGDFNEDGIDDLVTGYAIREDDMEMAVSSGSGMVGIQLGAPGRRGDRQTPFVEELYLKRVQTAPEFIEAGDFNADGHTDLVLGATSRRHLHWLPGRGNGSFESPKLIELDGRLSIMGAADVNRPDGLTDVVVGIESSRPGVLVFEGPLGAFSHEPERIDLDHPPAALAMARLSVEPRIDIAVGSGHDLVVIEGRDRRLTAPESWKSNVPSARRTVRRLDSEIRSLAAGRFTGGGIRDLAVVTDDGKLRILDTDRDDLVDLPYAYTWSQSGRAPVLLATKASSLQNQDLVVLDHESQRLEIFHRQHMQPEAAQPRDFIPETRPIQTGPIAPVAFEIEGGASAVLTSRLNIDALHDLIVVKSAASGANATLSNVAIVESKPIASFVVDTDAGGINAGDDDSGDGVCRAHSGGCTYAAAVAEANALPGPDMITFSIDTITEQSWTSGALITETVTIDGGGILVATSQGSIHTTDEATGVTITGVTINGGITFTGSDTEGTDNVAEANWVGLDGTGTAVADPSFAWRIDMLSGFNEVIDNRMQGMRVVGSGNTVQGNYVGLSADGSTALERTGAVNIGSNPNGESTLNLFGGTEAGTGNVVGDRYTLVREATGTLIQGNIFGADASGTVLTDTDDSFSTVDLQNSPETTVGGTAEGARNLFVGIGSNGLRLSVAPNSIVQGNYVGTDITGADSLGNEDHGISVRLSEGSIIGGSSPAASNLVSANTRSGIFLQGDGADVAIIGNRIGVDALGGSTLGNGETGILIDGDGWTVGGGEPGEGNVIGGNFGPGIWVDGRDAVIVGNLIGTDRLSADVGNTGDGIFLDLPARNTVIGGTNLAGQGNTIAHNGGSGIFADMNLRDVAFWYQNSIYDNDRLGIDLADRDDADDGVTPNDDDDRDGSGPNNYQNFPELVKNADGTVQVTLDSEPNTTYRIEYFGSPACDPSDHGEGKAFLFAEDVTTDADGFYSASKDISTIAGRQSLTAIAIDPVNGASEFSMCAEADVEPAFSVIVHSDSLGFGFAPVAPNTRVDVFQVDLSDVDSPFTSVGSQVTDDEGRILLDPATFGPGDPFMISVKVDDEESPKSNRSVVDFYAYQTYVDNMIIGPSGSVTAIELPESTDTELHTYLGHVTVAFNLIVSVEWRVTSTYLNGLQLLLVNTSNFLYDMTNGQARLGKVAIFDGKRMWADADIHIEAANTTWPAATPYGIGKKDGTLDLPPKQYGGYVVDNIRGTFNEVDIDPNNLLSVVTVGHEMGHYLLGLLDEYEDVNGVTLRDNVNFSVMDQTVSRHPRASELSAFESMTQDERTKYEKTQQFAERGGLDGWTIFAGLFTTQATPNVPAIISRPSRQGVSHPNVVTGPNEDLVDLDLNVAYLTEFVINVSSEEDPRPTFLLTDKTGRPRGDVSVSLVYNSGSEQRWINQGKPVPTGADRGKIRLIGSRPGSRLLAAGASSEGFSFAEVEVPTTSGKLADDIIVELQDVVGDQTMLATVAPEDGGGLSFSTTTSESLGDQPSIEMIAGGGSVDIPLTGGPTGYSAGLPGDVGESALILRATDTEGTPYPVPHQLDVFDVDEATSDLRTAGTEMELILDSTDVGVGRVSIVTSPFPAPEAGIPDSMVIASPVFGISMDLETDGEFSPRLKIYYDADSLFTLTSTGVTIFRWDELAAAWSTLPTFTSGDTTGQNASTVITNSGLYVAYLDLGQATATTSEQRDPEIPNDAPVGHSLSNYPNPVKGTTRIPIALDESALVSLTVYNVLGQEVERVEPKLLPAGETEIELDASRLPPGTYVYVARIGTDSRRGVLNVVR